MKKIVGILGAAVMLASSVFAADMAAKVYMTGNVAGGTFNGDATEAYFWNLTKQDQKDADALVISTNGDKSGANFQFWYNYDGSGSANLVVRSTNLWFKPIDMVKVIVGDVSESNYKEHIDWWKVAKGEAASAHQTYTWSSYATVEGSGLAVEVTPIDGLTVNAGVAPGAGTNWMDISKSGVSYLAYGAGAQYNFSNLLGIPLSAAISWRDAGNDAEKILSIGADYGNDFADGIYAMVNLRVRWDQTKFTVAYGDENNTTTTVTRALSLDAIALDNYVKYAAGALKIQVRAPITIRGIFGTPDKKYDFMNTTYGLDSATVDKAWASADPCWMSYEVKIAYALGSFTPYLDIENDTAVTFNSDFGKKLLNTTFQAGVSLNVGSCAIDIGAKLDLSGAEEGKISWSVPFTAGVAF